MPLARLDSRGIQVTRRSFRILGLFKAIHDRPYDRCYAYTTIRGQPVQLAWRFEGVPDFYQEVMGIGRGGGRYEREDGAKVAARAAAIGE